MLQLMAAGEAHFGIMTKPTSSKPTRHVLRLALFSVIVVSHRCAFVRAFGQRSQQASDERTRHVKSRPSFRPWQRHAGAAYDSHHDGELHQPPRTLLHSLTSAARHGSSLWSNHVAQERTLDTKPTSLKHKSSVYVSQLYKRLQQTRLHQGPLYIDTVTHSEQDGRRRVPNDDSRSMEEEAYRSRKSHWPAHFFEDTLAYIAGGAAATSAFSAVVVGTIFATVVVTIGAVASAFFFGNDISDDANHYLNVIDGTVDNDYVESRRPTLNGRDCDLNDAVYPMHAAAKEDDSLTSHSSTIDDLTLQELKKCFAGKPSTRVLFSTDFSGDACSIHDEPQLHHLSHFESNGSVRSSDLPAFVHGVDSSSGVENGLECNEDAWDLRHSNEPHVETSRKPAKQDDKEQTKKVELIWHDVYTTAANTYYAGKMNHDTRRTSDRESRKTNVSDQNFEFEDTEREGAILLSDTFRVTSSAFGLLADAVRFTGESAAAAAGGTARLVGGAVRAGGWAMGSLGSAISSEKSTGDEAILTANSDKERHKIRKVAGASVKLLGDAIDNVAESLLLAGSATERIAFACTGAAEGTIRIVEDFASSLSDAFARESRKTMVSNKPPVILMDKSLTGKVVHDDNTDPAGQPVAESPFASIVDVPLNGRSFLPDDVDEVSLAGNLSTFLRDFSTWTLQISDHIMKDTVGVSSLAPHVLFVLFGLYFASVILLSANGREKREGKNDLFDRNQGSKKINSSQISERKVVPEGIADDDDDTHSTLTVDSTMEREPDAHIASKSTRSVLYFIFSMAMMPAKLVRVVFVRFYQVVFSRKTALLFIHLLGWMFISQTSQNRSALIQRKAGLAGYKSAVESIGKSSFPGRNNVESAFWLNAIISTVWRVASKSADVNSEIGGLEPLLANSVSSIFARRLEESFSTPSGVAHVSLDSFTFGKSPPIIRDIEVKGIDAKEAKVYFGLDVVMLLDDATLMLDIKPSSLEYKMVPSTKVAINSLGLQLPLDLSVQANTEYPYLSFVNLSLSSIPDFSLRIVPQQESGLRGIDFGSFPLISKWVKEVINSSVEDYRSPHYVSIDIPAWLMGTADEVVKYF